MAEQCYQKAQAFEKLNLFYSYTGQTHKLAKMTHVAAAVKDPLLRFSTALFNQNAEERVRVMAENGQIPLAYLTAVSHGLQEMAATLEEVLSTTDGVCLADLKEQALELSAQGKPLTPLQPL